jgi:hypothetical protein
MGNAVQIAHRLAAVQIATRHHTMIAALVSQPSQSDRRRERENVKILDAWTTATQAQGTQAGVGLDRTRR